MRGSGFACVSFGLKCALDVGFDNHDDCPLPRFAFFQLLQGMPESDRFALLIDDADLPRLGGGVTPADAWNLFVACCKAAGVADKHLVELQRAAAVAVLLGQMSFYENGCNTSEVTFENVAQALAWSGSEKRSINQFLGINGTHDLRRKILQDVRCSV